ncbi:hypothetical protein FVE85_6559 [Porphyridium purpureum]|uniref:Uncharacterized protein n=1 Tax=Porphyridium purpureum TaxID=35688 RepID=A0A5J4Z7K1_PORPP|nr:hypothetical protein FVE85_6559 [Porphyridium purpureum]|eukprot:POR0164..scf295_1
MRVVREARGSGKIQQARERAKLVGNCLPSRGAPSSIAAPASMSRSLFVLTPSPPLAFRGVGAHSVRRVAAQTLNVAYRRARALIVAHGKENDEDKDQSTVPKAPEAPAVDGSSPPPGFVAVPAGELGIERARDLCAGLYSASMIWQGLASLGEILLLFRQEIDTITLLLAGFRLTLKALVGVLLYVSREAVLHNRTTSETYRRINMALIAYSVVNIYGMQSDEGVLQLWSTVPWVKGNPSLGGSYIMYFASILTWWTAVGGGLKAVEVLLQRVPIRILKSVADISVTRWKNVSALPIWYAVAIGACALAGAAGSFATIPVSLGASSDLAQFAYRMISREALVLLIPVYFTLWDAAQRDRLAASTFRYLRAALAVVDLARSALLFVFLRSKLALQLPTPASLVVGALLLLFHVVSGAVSVSGLVRKK